MQNPLVITTEPQGSAKYILRNAVQEEDHRVKFSEIITCDNNKKVTSDKLRTDMYKVLITYYSE